MTKETDENVNSECSGISDFVNQDFCKYQFSQTPDKCLGCVLSTIIENQSLFLATRINKLLQAFDDVHSYDNAPDNFDTSKHVVESLLVKGISSIADDDDDNVDETIKVFQEMTGGKEYTLENILAYIAEKQIKIDIHDIESLEILLHCCLFLADMEIRGLVLTEDDYIKCELIKPIIMNKASEALGYWTAKWEHSKRSTNQETKQQQEAMKEKYVTETWLKMINNSDEKKELKNLSLNKIAKRIQERVMPDLRNAKTQTGKYVLTRKKKTDKDGKAILSGLSIDTIISIMRKQDRFNFNPFKK